MESHPTLFFSPLETTMQLVNLPNGMTFLFEERRDDGFPFIWVMYLNQGRVRYTGPKKDLPVAAAKALWHWNTLWDGGFQLSHEFSVTTLQVFSDTREW
jgi:hypothetical protein